MDIENFKKELNVTYVHVWGDIRGVPVMETYAKEVFHYTRNCFKYNGYITVPFCYKDFKSFTDLQQKAICEAEFVKAGICVKVDRCDADMFYSSKDECS